MKFSKYNNPRKKGNKKHYTYSKEFYKERKEELYRQLATEPSEYHDDIIKAFYVSMNP